MSLIYTIDSRFFFSFLFLYKTQQQIPAKRENKLYSYDIYDHVYIEVSVTDMICSELIIPKIVFALNLGVSEKRTTDHLQLSMEANDAAWRERCNEKMGTLRKTQISASHSAGILQEQLSFEKKFMILELCTCVKDKNADRFVDKLKDISDKTNLSLANILDQVTHTGDSLLHMAAHFGAEEIGELIACHFPELLTKRNVKGDTPLHVAARAKNPNVVRMILSQYDAVNSMGNEDNKLTRLENEHGNTALHEAVYTNHFETVSHLFEADKAVAHHLNKSGKSALHIAVVNLNKGILYLLLEASFVDKPLAQHHGISPLHAAISKKDSGVSTKFSMNRLTFILEWFCEGLDILVYIHVIIIIEPYQIKTLFLYESEKSKLCLSNFYMDR